MPQSVKGNKKGAVASPVPAQLRVIALPQVQPKMLKGYQARAMAKHYKGNGFEKLILSRRFE